MRQGFPQSICVFCGSRDGISERFAQDAERLGSLIAQHNARLVYGAGDVGLMGRVARAVQQGGGDVFGVITQHLVEKEVGKTDITNYIVVETMHERKKIMFCNSDAIVILPGGAGTLDEFFEVLTWRQLHMHDKPIFLLNTQGYWTPLIDAVQHLVTQGFADESLLSLFQVVDSPEAVFEGFA